MTASPDKSPECRLCESTNTDPVVPAPQRPMWHCLDCHLVFVDETALPDPKAEHDRYLTHNNCIDDERYVNTFAVVRAAITQNAQKGAAVLDYGSGPSPVLVELLRRDGFNACGYDPFFTDELDRSQQFDAITCVETAEHFARPVFEFEKMNAALCPGGLLIVKTQLHQGPEHISDWWYARDFTHVAFYATATFAIIAAKLNGATVEHLAKDVCLFRKPK